MPDKYEIWMTLERFIEILKDEDTKAIHDFYSQFIWYYPMPTETFRLLYDAIKKYNNPSVHHILGYINYHGKHGKTNKEKAFHYFQLSADKGNSYGYVYMAFYYINGEFVEKDLGKGLYYLRKAAGDKDNRWAYSTLRHNIVQKCFGEYFLETIDKLQQNNDDLQQKVIELTQENTDLRYRPNGPGYDEAREDFNNLKRKKL